MPSWLSVALLPRSVLGAVGYTCPRTQRANAKPAPRNECWRFADRRNSFEYVSTPGPNSAGAIYDRMVAHLVNSQQPWIQKRMFTLLDLCVSSLRRGHANLLCIVPILTDDPRRESKILCLGEKHAAISLRPRVILAQQVTSTHPQSEHSRELGPELRQ